VSTVEIIPGSVESPISQKPVRAPWMENPRALVSWWEMEQFSARRVYALGKLLERVRAEHVNLRKPGDPDFAGSAADCRLSNERVNGFCEFMLAIKEDTFKLGLKMVTRFVEDMYKNAHLLTNRQVSDNIAHLDKMLRWEMEEHLFFFIPAAEADYYDKPELLGADVLAKFPDLRYDIVEVGNCYATSRSTAVVFHLMRIMEVGVQEFGRKVGVSLVHEKNWQNILDEINKAVKALPKGGPQAVEMAQVAANLYSVKVAWRNEVMHPNDTYGQDEAKILIGLVKVFMGQLAGVI